MPLQALIAFPLLTLALASSLSDWRRGKIPHRHIRFGLLVGALFYALLVASEALFLDSTDFLAHGLPAILVATLAGFVAGLGMWWGGVWSGGDAKLFTVFLFLFPNNLLLAHVPAVFVPLVLLVNAYTAAFAVITLDFLQRSTRLGATWLSARRHLSAAERRERSRAFWQARRTALPGQLKTLVGFLVVFLLLRLLRGLVRAPLESFRFDNTTIFLFLFLLFRPLHRLFQNKWVACAAALGLSVYVGRLLAEDPSGEALWHVVRMGVMSVALLLFRALYTFWANLVEVEQVPLDELAAHRLLPRRVYEALVAQGLLTPDEQRELSVEGLSAEQAARIRAGYQNDRTPGRIDVERTIPFAPFLTLGLLLTVLFRDIALRFTN